MKTLTLEAWDRKYVVGEIEPFEQKNTMFSRPAWDPEVSGRLEDWSFVGEVKDRPGIYAGGDIIRGAGTVVEAVADGRRAAIAIDSKIKGKFI